jgi:outer membrane protein OmpA-like peptidoglycan-associated protein
MRQGLIIILLTISSLAHGQLTNFSELWRSQEYRGDRLFSQGLYESAIESYKKEIEQNKVNANATARIAESYKILGHYDLSRRYYDILANTGQLDDLKHYENYADVLLSSSKSERAMMYYQMALKEEPENNVLKDKILGINMSEEFTRNAEYIIINPVSFNTEDSEYGMRPYRNKYSFTSNGVTDIIIHHNYLRDLDGISNVFIVDYDSSSVYEPEILNINDYRLKNDGPLSLSGDLIAISRNNSQKSGKQNKLGIFFYREDEKGKLVHTSDFPFNSAEHSVTHPYFNSTGDTIYFASDMPGGFGGMDIYYSPNVGSVWLAPVNLGEKINTARNEIYPFSDGTTLFFSSDGHPGLGGIDTYKIITEQGNKKVTNLGYPLNTSWDDFGIYIDGDRGFIASNNPDGKGSDDIYEFQLLPIPIIIEPIAFKLSLTDSLSNTPITSALVSVIQDLDTMSYTSDMEGVIEDNIMPGDYLVDVRKRSYVDYSFSISVDEHIDIERKIGLTSSVVTHIVSPDSILFKYGKYLLLESAPTAELDAIVETLNDYPEFILEISAHTDSRGTQEYNQWLSIKRASSAANYILSTGIDGSRIIQTGFGETKLLNNCRDGIKCSAKLHAVNRRLEFDFKRVEDPK